MLVKTTNRSDRAAMEGQGVDLVLSRAVELRLQISNCIHKATVSSVNGDSEEKKEGRVLEELNPNSLKSPNEAEADEDDDGEDAERLLRIRDALETLEHQLSNLQALQQQQRYEREVALSEIEQSRKMLLDKLKDYKGPDLEVIKEASTFVGETVEHSNDLLLPPYPIRSPPSLVLDNQYLSHHALQKVRNGEFTPNHYNREKPSNTTRKGIGGFIGAVAKTLITVVGVVSVLSLSGFGAKFGRGRLQLKMGDLFEKPESEERKTECPTGKVLVWENGEAQCVVKERVVIPFAAVGSKPDLDYGCG